MYANVHGDSSLFLAEQVNVDACRRTWGNEVTPEDYHALQRSNDIVKALLAALVDDGTPLASLKHAHDCFARGLCFSEK